jgi:hypothetical protein
VAGEVDGMNFLHVLAHPKTPYSYSSPSTHFGGPLCWSILRINADRMSTSHPLTGVLFAPAPHPSLDENLSTAFSKLIGSWNLTMRRYSSPSHLSDPLIVEGEWHFGWVLNGLAVQDVWIVPKRATSSNSFPSVPRAISGDRASEFLEYGTAIRFFSRQEGKYRAVWAGPLQGKTYLFTAEARNGNEVGMVAREHVPTVEREVGLKEGKIELEREVGLKEGKIELEEEGMLMKWHLTEIQQSGFKWKEWMSEDEGASWRLREEFDCVRMQGEWPGAIIV